MSALKRLRVGLSDTQWSEFDAALREDSKKRSEFIREAIILYIEEKKRMRSIEEIKQGFLEMAQLNLEFAEIGFSCDVCELDQYEAKLSESDLPDDDVDGEKRRYFLC